MKGLSRPLDCDPECEQEPCAVPVEEAAAGQADRATPGSASCNTGAVRCNCPALSFGYVKRGGDVDAEGRRRRVADLSDNATTTMLACASCPDGIFCQEPGQEFARLRLFPGRWQSMEYLEGRPEVLFDEGVADCIATTDDDERCTGGNWANFTCNYGFSGPASRLAPYMGILRVASPSNPTTLFCGEAVAMPPFGRRFLCASLLSK